MYAKIRKTLPIILVIVLSACGKSPVDKCIDELYHNGELLDVLRIYPQSVRDNFSPRQRSAFSALLQSKYENVRYLCKNLHK